MPPTHYQTLGVDPRATPDQIRRAYRALAKLHHPDVSDSKDAAKLFARIAAAYQTLSDPTLRLEYDRTLAVRAAKATDRSQSDLRQNHYAWVSVAAPREGAMPDISEVDELYQTFFGAARRPAKAKPKPDSPPNKHPPNARGARKPTPRRRSSG